MRREVSAAGTTVGGRKTARRGTLRESANDGTVSDKPGKLDHIRNKYMRVLWPCMADAPTMVLNLTVIVTNPPGYRKAPVPKPR